MVLAANPKAATTAVAVGMYTEMTCGVAEPTRIDEGQGIVVHVGVAVRALRVEHAIDERVPAEEPARRWVIHSPIHVDETDTVQVLVTGKAAARDVADCGQVARTRRPAPVSAIPALARGTERGPHQSGTGTVREEL